MTRVGSARRAGLGASAIAVVGAIGLVGCAAADGDSGPRVVVTTNILGDVASELIGDAADVTTLMKPNADPHSFEISAQEAATLQSAELVISNGLGLEEGVEQHLEAAADAGAPRFIAADHLETIPYAEKANGPDPHFWTDPARMIDVVEALETELGEIGIDVSANAAAYLEDLAELDAEMSDAFARIPNEHRALVTNHHVFGYLADRFDFEVIGAAIPGEPRSRRPRRPTSTSSLPPSTRAACPRSSRNRRSPTGSCRCCAPKPTSTSRSSSCSQSR